jgi:hypothetical protein
MATYVSYSNPKRFVKRHVITVGYTARNHTGSITTPLGLLYEGKDFTKE